MRRELAIYRSGRYVSNWPVVLIIGGIVGLVAGVAFATVRFLLGGPLSASSILLALVLSIGFVAGLSLRRCYMLQPEYGSGNRIPRR